MTPTLEALAGASRFLRLSHEAWSHYTTWANDVVQAWANACERATTSGDCNSLRAVRDEYEKLLLAHLKILTGYGVLARANADNLPAELPETIATAYKRLQQHYDSLFPRWQTLEDLESILLERISLPNDQLKALASQYPPPASWRNESDAPAPVAE